MPPDDSRQPDRTERPHPLTPLIRGWVVLLAIVIGVGKEFVPDGSEPGFGLPPLEWLLVGIGAVCVVAILVGYWTWRFTRFVMDDEELRIDSGIVFHNSQRIAFARIQSIDVVQPFAARLFGLAELQIDLGGEHTKLRYLGLARAYGLRDYLLERAHGHAPASPAAPGSTDLTSRLSDLQEPDQVLVRVQPPTLLLAAVTSHEFILICLAAAATVVVALGFGHWWALFAIGIPTGSALVGFVSRRVIAQFNYTLSRRPSGLRITRGLTTLTSQSLPANRVQGVQLSQSLLWRPLGLYRIDLEVLGWGKLTEDENDSGVSSVMLPCGDAQQVATALAALWPSVDPDTVPTKPVPARARWLHPLSAPFLRWGHDEAVMVVQRGWFVRRRQIVPLARVQSLAIDQGLISRQLGLANLSVHTAGLQLSVTAKGNDATALAEVLPALLALVGRHHVADVAAAPPQPAAGPEALLADHAEATISSTE